MKALLPALPRFRFGAREGLLRAFQLVGLDHSDMSVRLMRPSGISGGVNGLTARGAIRRDPSLATPCARKAS